MRRRNYLSTLMRRGALLNQRRRARVSGSFTCRHRRHQVLRVYAVLHL